MRKRIELTLACVLLCAPAATGGENKSTLKLQTDPTEAEVFLGEQLLGNTPFVTQELSPGLHELTVKKDGFVPLNLQVYLKKNKTVHLGTIPLARKNTLITIWRVGSPHDGAMPPAEIPKELEGYITARGFRVQTRSFNVNDFAREFSKALEQDEGSTLPDIVAGNNYLPFEKLLAIKSTKERLRSATGVLTMIDPFVFVVAHSPGHTAANQIAAANLGIAGPRFSWSLDEQELKDLPGQLPAREDKSSLEDLNYQAVLAYLRGNLPGIAPLLHKEMLSRQGAFRPGTTPPTVGHIRTLYTLGNARLAFVLATASYWNEATLGCREVLSIWVKAENQWRLLSITVDPVSIMTTRKEIPNLARALTQDEAEPVQSAKSLVPRTGLPSPSAGERFAFFRWTPSSSKEVVAEIAEFNYGNASRFFFQPGGKVSAGYLWTMFGPWSWRVWSIGKDGQVVMSEVGRFQQ